MSAAVVLPAPGRFSTTNCWPSAPVHFAASMRARVSGLPPGARPTRTRTGFCGQACARAAPGNVAAARPINRAKRFMLPPSDLRMDAEQVRNRLRRSPPEPALGGDAEIPGVPRRRRDALPRPRDAVRIVHQPEKELRPRIQLQPDERRKMVLVVALDGHGIV